MQDVHQILRDKEVEIVQVRQEIAALRLTFRFWPMMRWKWHRRRPRFILHCVSQAANKPVPAASSVHDLARLV